MSFVSFAQNAEDVLLFRALRYLEQGHYVDIGANHPVEDSVTKAFYDRGWTGVNVEPVGFWHEKLQMERAKDLNLQIAISDRDESLDFFEVQETGLSTLDPERAEECRQQGLNVVPKRVACWTLAHLFQEIGPRDTHFLKIDVEGAEAQVIRSGDWNKHRPWIVLVESTRPNTNQSEHESWEPILLDAGYQFVWFDGVNRYYLAQEHGRLIDTFQIPINVLDNYITFREVALTESRLQLILDMDWKQVDFQTELLSAKEAIDSAKIAHDNALSSIESQSAAIESQSAAIESQAALLGWYHSDPLIRTAIKLRKLPGYCKRYFGRHMHKYIDQSIQFLDRFPERKIQLATYLSNYPWLVRLLRWVSARPLPRLKKVRVVPEFSASLHKATQPHTGKNDRNTPDES